MRKRGLIVMILAAIAISCSSNPGVYSGSDPGKAIVGGSVNAHYGFGFDGYTEMTGRVATISFYGDQGNQYTLVNDDNSNYALELDTGLYTVTVDSWHTWPQTWFEVPIRRDTSINLELFLDYQDPDSIRCTFAYNVDSDTLGQEQEMHYVTRLAIYTGQIIQPEGARRQYFGTPGYPAWTIYTVPVRTGMRVWSVVDRSNQAMRLGGSAFPDYMHVEPIGLPDIIVDTK